MSSNRTGSEDFNIFAENSAHSKQKSNKESGEKFNMNENVKDKRTLLQKMGYFTPNQEKSIKLVLPSSKDMDKKIVYRKKGYFILLRRFGAPPDMTKFQDFMFFYIGDQQEMDHHTFQNVANHTNFVGQFQDLDNNIVRNRFNFLLYSAPVYKQQIFSQNHKPEILTICFNFLKYLEHIIARNSESTEEIFLEEEICGKDFCEGNPNF
jgi:hypothetical protein